MEGVGSRLGRSSSRYGTTATTPAGSTPVFTGPVRKWRRQWVTTSEPATTNNNNNRGKQQDASPPLLLCRWIPLPNTASAAVPPKRKLRYAPVTAFEELKKKPCKVAGVDGNKVKKSETNRMERSDAAATFGKSQNTDAFLQDMKELMMGQAQVNQLFLDKF